MFECCCQCICPLWATSTLHALWLLLLTNLVADMRCCAMSWSQSAGMLLQQAGFTDTSRGLPLIRTFKRYQQAAGRLLLQFVQTQKGLSPRVLVSVHGLCLMLSVRLHSQLRGLVVAAAGEL